MPRTELLLKMAADLGRVEAAHEAAIEKEAGTGEILKYLIPGLGGIALGAAIMESVKTDEIASTADKIRESLMTTPPSALQEMLTQGLPPEVAQHMAYYQTPAE
jgi:hypothetical protein